MLGKCSVPQMVFSCFIENVRYSRQVLGSIALASTKKYTRMNTLCSHHYSLSGKSVWGCIHNGTCTSYGLFIFIRVKLVQVERSQSLVQAQTLVNSDATKNLVKIVKHIEFLTKVYSTITRNVRSCWRQNCVISLLVYK